MTACRPRVCLLVLLVVVLLAPGLAAARSLAVLTDGKFDEWGKKKPRVVDPAGDGEEGALDLRRLWIADDGEALYLRLQVGRETLMQNSPNQVLGNLLRLYIDVDKKKGTGLPVGAIGVDLEVRFGERQVISYDASSVASLALPGAGAVQALPTYSSDVFEIRIQLPEVRKRAARVGKRRKLKFFLREESAEGDRLPDQGVVVYKLGKKPVAAPEPIDLARPAGNSLRIVSINVEDALIGVVPEIYTRFLQAIQPDIVCLQSLRDWDAARALAFIEEVLPLGGGRSWTNTQVDDIHTLSSFPVAVVASIDANLVSYLELPDNLGGGNLALFNAHFPCCDNDAGRDEEVDNLMAFWRNSRIGAGIGFEIDERDPVILLGDFNLVGFNRQFLALRDGVFVDPSSGPDFAPGRSEGSLREAPLRHTHRRLIHTWRRATSEFSPGKLDFVLYTGDTLELVKSFVPDTEGMPEDFLEAVGLEAMDTLEMSDHLPLVVDFELR